MKYSLLKVGIFLTACQFSINAVEPETVHLPPPVITSNSVLEKIAAVRPMRKGSFNISVDTKEEKLSYTATDMEGQDLQQYLVL